MEKKLTDIEELVQSADHLCKTLSEAAENEKQFSYKICLELERMSWETQRMANDLKTLQ